MRPTPSLRTQMQNGAQLWASGNFTGMDEWVDDNNIELLVNLLGRRVSRRCVWKEWDMNKAPMSSKWLDTLCDILTAMTVALHSGHHHK